MQAALDDVGDTYERCHAEALGARSARKAAAAVQGVPSPAALLAIMQEAIALQHRCARYLPCLCVCMHVNSDASAVLTRWHERHRDQPGDCAGHREEV